MHEIRRLKARARAWGGDLVEVSSSEYGEFKRKGLFVAPFAEQHKLGIDWLRRRIVYSGKVYWPHVVHEMGHVFAMNEQPNKVEEFSFFGWEYQLAKQIGNTSEWLESNEDYHVGDTFGIFSHKEKQKILEERIEWGQDIGIIDRLRQPLSCLVTNPPELMVTGFHQPGGFDCYDCLGDAPGYMVRNSVWESAWPGYNALKEVLRRLYGQGPNTFLCLCLPCLQLRCHRPLTMDDFDLEIPINWKLKLP